MLLLLSFPTNIIYLSVQVWMYDLVCGTAVSKPDRNCMDVKNAVHLTDHHTEVCTVSFKDFKGAIEMIS